MTTCVNFSEARTSEFEAEYRDATQRVEMCLSSEGVPSSKSQRVEQGDLVCELLCKCGSAGMSGRVGDPHALHRQIQTVKQNTPKEVFHCFQMATAE